MLSSIPGITPGPLQSNTPPVSKPPFKLEQRQRFDAFFSNKSIKAQMSRFLQHPPKKPLMFSYSWQDGNHVLNRWFAPSQSVVLVRPEIKKPDTNPFSQPLKKEEAPGSSLHVKIQQVDGHPLAPETHVQLEQAFKQGGLSPGTPRWVHQIAADNIKILRAPDPVKAGFAQVQLLWQSALHMTLGILAPLLGLKVEDKQIRLPNGAQLTLQPKGWVDGNGQGADLYKTMRLPNGKWFKVNNMAFEERFAFDDKKAIRDTLDRLVQQIEERGGIRDLLQQANPLDAIMAGSQQPFQTPPAVTKSFGSATPVRKPFGGVVRGKAASSIEAPQ